jgi:hypothetical protein
MMIQALFTLLMVLELAMTCSAEVGTVRLRVVNSLGVEETNFTIDRFVDRKGNDFRQRFQGGIGTAVPYGTYEIRISSHKGGATKQVGVYQKSVFHILDIGGIDYPDRNADDIISGRLIPAPTGPPQTWIKSVSLYGDQQSTWEVRADGTFSMYNLDPGRYVLLVIQGTKVLKVVFHEFQSTVHPPLAINLK